MSFLCQVCDLKENMKYQFQVRAANMAGVGIPSLPSDTFLCEEWTIAVPGLLDQWFTSNSFFFCLYSMSLESVNVTTILYKTVFQWNMELNKIEIWKGFMHSVLT